MVTVTIDSKQIEVPEGTTVLRAAQSSGIHIPTLCDHPKLTPYGGCRLCLVEVEGARTLQPSCTMPVSNNMVIHTDTQKVLDARKFVLTLIFSERNHFCPYCQVSGGDCELQNSAYDEGMTHWPLSPNFQPYPVDASHPYIIMENNRCILCRRCVRACGELVGNYTLGFEERGAKSLLVADTGVALGESTCISCGTCVQVCPTGALIDRWSAYHGHDTQADTTQTICVGCSVGCGIDVLTRDNNLVKINGNWDAEINGGVICKLGRFDAMEEKCDRIATPLVRKDGALKAATWEEAIAAAANGLKSAGMNSAEIAAVISTRQPVETLSAFKQLFGGKLGSTNLTTLEEGEFTRSTAKLAEESGKAFEGKLADLKAADSILVLGADLVSYHEVVGFFTKRAVPAGTKLLVVDTKENELDRLANKALKAGKGSIEDTLNALTAAVVKLGLAKGKTAVKAGDLDALASKTGLKSEEYLDAAFVIASGEKPVILVENGVLPAAIADFAELIDARIISVKGNANSLAASQLKLENPLNFKASKVAFIVLGDDDASQKMIKDVEKVPFKIVQATYASALTANADVVLPSTNWLEQGGHYLNLDGHLQQAHRAITPAEEIMTAEESLTALASKLGFTLENSWEKELQQRVSSVVLE
ncbi:MAG: molybdopterin-dependent oxidoreductase [Anaerolineaceae bacterium]